MTQFHQTGSHPSDIRAGDVIRYRIRSYLGPATVRYSDPIRVVRVLDGGTGAVVVASDRPITVQGRRSVLLPPETEVLIQRAAAA